MHPQINDLISSSKAPSPIVVTATLLLLSLGFVPWTFSAIPILVCQSGEPTLLVAYSISIRLNSRLSIALTFCPPVPLCSGWTFFSPHGPFSMILPSTFSPDPCPYHGEAIINPKLCPIDLSLCLSTFITTFFLSPNLKCVVPNMLPSPFPNLVGTAT